MNKDTSKEKNVIKMGTHASKSTMLSRLGLQSCVFWKELPVPGKTPLGSSPSKSGATVLGQFTACRSPLPND
jgi:hypothetical protein